jgi:hypothetical protein
MVGFKSQIPTIKTICLKASCSKPLNFGNLTVSRATNGDILKSDSERL